MVKVRKEKDIEGILKEGERALKEELQNIVLDLEYDYRIGRHLLKDNLVLGKFKVYREKYRTLCKLGIDVKNMLNQIDKTDERDTPYSKAIKNLTEQYLKTLKEKRKG